MIRLEPITDFGQIKVGDVLLLKRSNEFVAPVTVKEVIYKGTADEEVIISKTKNFYFITSMLLDGTSWVKECARLINGKLYSVANNQNDFTCYHEDKVTDNG